MLDPRGTTAALPLPPPPPAATILLTHNVKVANVSPAVSVAVLETLFAFLGDVRNIYVTASPYSADTRECVVEFADASAVQSALHLTGTELGDRTLVVTANYTPPPQGSPVAGNMPLNFPLPAVPAAPGVNLYPQGHRSSVAIPPPPGLAHTATTTLASAVPPSSALLTNPTLLASYAAQQQAAMAFDPTRAEEIARTIYVGNISGYVQESQLSELCSAIGPVAFVKLAGAVDAMTRFAFVEFTNIDDARKALNMNGTILADRPLKISQSKNAINKPPMLRKPAETADVSAAMQRVREAQQRIASKYGVGSTSINPAPAAGPPPALPTSAKADSPSAEIPKVTKEDSAGDAKSRDRDRDRERDRDRDKDRERPSSRRRRSPSYDRDYPRRRSPSYDRERSRELGRYDYDRRRYRHHRSRSRGRDYGRDRPMYGADRDFDYDRRDDGWGRDSYHERRGGRERGRADYDSRRRSRERSDDRSRPSRRRDDDPETSRYRSARRHHPDQDSSPRRGDQDRDRGRNPSSATPSPKRPPRSSSSPSKRSPSKRATTTGPPETETPSSTAKWEKSMDRRKTEDGNENERVSPRHRQLEDGDGDGEGEGLVLPAADADAEAARDPSDADAKSTTEAALERPQEGGGSPDGTDIDDDGDAEKRREGSP